MIELLILFELNRKILTMYGVSKQIYQNFSVLTNPSYGTIQPALRRLEKNGFVKVQKDISKGGRRVYYYSITDKGVEELKRLIIESHTDNPIQFLSIARVKLACAEVLSKNEQIMLLKSLKKRTESILADAQNLAISDELSFYPKMVYDNLICEYKNFIMLLEGFAHACVGK